MIGIYKITSPTGKVYVGQTKDYNKRFKSYRRRQCRFQHKIYNSILKYGWDNHKMELIVECSIDKLDEREVFYINKYNCLDRDLGLNIKLGGALGLSQESINKMALTMKQRFIDNPNLKNKMSEMGLKSALKTRGQKKSREHINKIIATKIKNGTLASSIETTNRMAATQRKKFAEDPSMRLRMVEIHKLSKCNAKAVRCILTDKKWESCKEMCEELNLNLRYTRKQLNGSRTNFTTFEYVTKP